MVETPVEEKKSNEEKNLSIKDAEEDAGNQYYDS